jgi:hypothetical protein
MKIIRIYLERLRNDAHFEFFSIWIVLVNKYPFIKGKIEELFDAFLALFDKEDEVVNFNRSSDYSAKIQVADRRLDAALVGLNEFVRGAVHHFNATVAEAALSLKNLLKNYGYITRRNYDEKLAAVTNLLQDLDGPWHDKVLLISSLAEWIEAIRAAAAEETELIALRNAEIAARPQERMPEVRREVDISSRNIIARIEAFMTIEGEANYAAFVSELNAAVERFNRLRPHKKEK